MRSDTRVVNKLEQHVAVRLVHNCVLRHGLAVVVGRVEVLPFESLDSCVRQLGLEMDSFHWHTSISSFVAASMAEHWSMTAAYTVSETLAVR